VLWIKLGGVSAQLREVVFWLTSLGGKLFSLIFCFGRLVCYDGIDSHVLLRLLSTSLKKQKFTLPSAQYLAVELGHDRFVGSLLSYLFLLKVYTLHV